MFCSLKETIEKECYENVALLPEEYDDAVVGIDDCNLDVVVYCADMLSMIDSEEEWMKAVEQTVKKHKDSKEPLLLVYKEEEYDDYEIPENAKGGIIGMSTKGNIILSHDKLVDTYTEIFECDTDTAEEKVDNFEKWIEKNDRKDVIVVRPLNGYEDVYNVLSFRDYEIEEESDDELEDDTEELIKEGQKSLRKRDVK